MAKRKTHKHRRSYNPFKRHRRRSKSHSIPILPLLGGVVAPVAQSFETVGGMATLQNDPYHFVTDMLDQIGQRYTGFSIFPDRSGSHGFNFTYVFETYGGLAAGLFGHWIANKAGLNRMMKKVPFIGKYVSL